MSEGQVISEVSTSPKELPQDPNISGIKDIFGNKAVIEQTKEGYKVKSILEDGVVEGGQQIETELLFPDYVYKGSGDHVYAMKVKKLKINESDITKEFAKIFFVIRPEGLSEYHGKIYPKEFLALKRTGNELVDHLREQVGTSINTDKEMFTATFKKGEDLVSLFHEQGHAMDKNASPEERQSLLSQFHFDSHSLDKENLLKGTEEVKQSILSTWKKIIERETTANKNALKMIRALSRRIHLFPNDEETGFPRVKKSREVNLKGYLEVLDGWYLSQISPQELTELTRLD